jgi:hypothetical protein
MKIVGMDVGSTTVKTVIIENDRILWQDYQRHNTRQAASFWPAPGLGDTLLCRWSHSKVSC